MSTFARISIVLLIVLLNVGCDQISKVIVRQNIGEDDRFPMLGETFTLMKVENTGAFLSMGNNLPGAVKGIFLSAIPLIVLAIAFIYIIRRPDVPKSVLVGISFMIGGGIGNIIDRIAFGSVTDFMFIHIGFFKTGIFNFADVSIVIGTILIALGTLFNRKKEVPQV